MNYQSALLNLTTEHEFFIGIDSDGCVFDTMEIKQKEFFIPNAVRIFSLTEISEILAETWEFVNLYSVYRGGNRFTSLIKVFELLSEREEIKRIGFKLPDMTSLKTWVKNETKLGNETLRKYFEANYDPDLEKVVRWSETVNSEIRSNLGNIPPFPHAKAAIEKISEFADLIIVSQTPLEALEREWESQNMKKYIKAICGQEHGTKTDHIALAAKGKYPDNKILMIGDAKGDLDAARNNGILFYPVIPGREDESWKRFLEDGLIRFKENRFSRDYQHDLLSEFTRSLPFITPWK
jgi:phosphoglycolate phosphatase-like HAD superfamily hydrolase